MVQSLRPGLPMDMDVLDSTFFEDAYNLVYRLGLGAGGRTNDQLITKGRPGVSADRFRGHGGGNHVILEDLGRHEDAVVNAAEGAEGAIVATRFRPHYSHGRDFPRLTRLRQYADYPVVFGDPLRG